jgi:hypothetical protein
MTCQNQTLYFSLRKFLLGEENSHLTLREEIPIHILRPCFLNPLRFKHCLLKLSYKRTIHLQYDHSSLITAEEQSPKKNPYSCKNHFFIPVSLVALPVCFCSTTSPKTFPAWHICCCFCCLFCCCYLLFLLSSTTTAMKLIQNSTSSASNPFLQ